MIPDGCGYESIDSCGPKVSRLGWTSHDQGTRRNSKIQVRAGHAGTLLDSLMFVVIPSSSWSR